MRTKYQFRPIATAVCLAVMMSGCGGGSNTRTDNNGMLGAEGTDTDSQQPHTGPEQPSTNVDRAHDWLLTGTVASQQARDEGIAAVKEILVHGSRFEYDSSFDPPHYSLGGSSFVLANLVGVNELPLEDEVASSPFAWGYWSHANFELTAELFQRTRYSPSSVEDVTEKLVVAVMDHGYFGIGHLLSESHPHADSPTTTHFGTSGFYAVDNSLNLGGSRDLRSLDLTGSIWTGDAFAIERHSQAGTGRVGIVELIVTDEINVGYVGSEYSVALNINLENGQHFSMTGTAGGADDFGNPSDIFAASGGQTDADGIPEYLASGQFAGANAEQAFGAFEVPDYYGSFGLTQYSEN